MELCLERHVQQRLGPRTMGNPWEIPFEWGKIGEIYGKLGKSVGITVEMEERDGKSMDLSSY